MEKANKTLQWVLILGTIGYIIWCLFDSECWAWSPLLLIPIGAVQYICSFIMVFFFDIKRFRIHLVLATVDLLVFFGGASGFGVMGLPIFAMAVGLLLALYYFYLTFDQSDFYKKGS